MEIRLMEKEINLCFHYVRKNMNLHKCSGPDNDRYSFGYPQQCTHSRAGIEYREFRYNCPFCASFSLTSS